VIVVVGRETDAGVQALLQRWRDSDAALLTPRDLSRAGWAHRPASPAEGRAVVAGRAVAVGEIRGVVAALETLTTRDIAHIVRRDRPYVVAEMYAFLLAWLRTLPCRVLNRPTPQSLAGCGWQREQWVLVADALGIPTVAVCEPADGSDEHDTAITVTQVADRTLDAPTDTVAAWVVRLAAAAQTSTLVARFRDGSPPRFVSAGVVPDFSRPQVADGVLRWIEGASA
jgi:hypothetical protein